MILIAPTSYKGTIGATSAARAMAAGAIRAGYSDVDVCPVSDGGPGLIDALVRPGARLEEVIVHGPMGAPVSARILVDADVAFIESADACGLHLLTEPAPMRATTRGVGELIRAALGFADTVVVGLGGSGTVDGGTGAAAALGWRFCDRAGNPLDPAPAELLKIARIERPAEPLRGNVIGLADVETKLHGPDGAARVFGPQKGAAPADVERLDAALAHLAGMIARDVGIDVSDLTGGGAAGGLGAGLRAFAAARLCSGSQWLFERLRLAERIERADLVVTGEGRFDEQSAMGKITGALVAAARTRNKPVLLIAGQIRGNLPAGVFAIRSAQRLSPADLAALVERELPRLLPR